MKNNMRKLLFVAGLLFLIQACSTDKSKEKVSSTEKKEVELIKAPNFNADSAYHYVAEQVAYGPRVPNTKAHKATANYLADKLESFGANVQVQEFQMEAFTGEAYDLYNVIGTINPSAQKRILLAAHWDTRAAADKDPVDPTASFDGANDGASGVGVLLEIARAMQNAEKKPGVGVDIIFFDGEDNGQANGGAPETWCLGSQYWAKNKHKAGYSAYYGILLDMVGAKNAQFHLEGYSMQYAPSISNKVWGIADKIGYGRFFVPNEVPAITDDHKFVNDIARIPMIDILAYDPGSNQFFPDYHHTQKDNMDIISKETLGAVGEVVLTVLYNE